jgi:hypothetical protein
MLYVQFNSVRWFVIVKTHWTIRATIVAIAGLPSTLVLSGLGSLPALGNAPGNLTVEQARSLKALGIKIAVPSYVPTGFRVASVTMEPCPPNAKRTATGVCRFGPTYRILYRNPQRTCFEINAVGGGLGGPDPEFVFPVEIKLLGKTTLGFGKTPGDGMPASAQQLATPQSHIWSWPAGQSPYYQISTVENKDGCGTNRSLTPLEAKKILQSLTWLSAKTTASL